MSFDIGLSGLRASSTDLEASGNNIANASSIGFKRSRVEFGDVYASGLIGGGNATGSGVLVTDVAQQFDQGNISFTDNNLDLAINGGGFFVLSDAGAITYSRAGYFGLDNQGYIVSNDNSRLQGYPANTAGQITTGTLSDIQIQTQDIAPNATAASAIQFNLDSREAAPVAAFDPTDPSTYNSSTSVTIYDSLGNPAVMTHFFVKDDAAVPVAPATAVWDMHTFIDSGAGPEDTGNSYTLGFTDAGLLTSGGSTTVPVPPATAITHTPAAGTTAQSWSISLDVASSTQFGADFSVSRVDQDGFAPGRLAGIEVDDQGVLFARYTNGESNVLAQLALADFDNPQGLTPLGNTSWAESFASGQPITGSPQSGALGSIQSGALEESNVDLSEELVRLIIAQRNYQANAKTIETSDTVTQALLNIA